MSHRLHSAIRRWLRAERSGRDQSAEKALTRVFSRLPLEGPSGSFVSRVLAGAGYAVVEPWGRDLKGLRWRALAAACLALAAGAATFLPSVAQAAWVGLRSGKALELAIAFFVQLTEGLAQGLALIGTLIGTVRTVGGAFASPAVLAMIAASAVSSLLAFRVLQSLMVSQRSTYHA